jgi:ribosomal protein S18 acetylase RimI-like enzyme
VEVPLPEGFTTSRPTAEDAAAIYGLLASADLVAIGHVDSTLDDVHDALAEPGFDRDRDGWLVWRGHTVVGWAWACRKGSSDQVQIDVYTHPEVPEVASWLWDIVETRAAEIAAELGHPRAVVDIGVHRQDADKRTRAELRSYAIETSFYRMKVDHDVPPEPLAPPPGVTLLTVGDDEARRRAAHRVYEDSFQAHFGFVSRTYDEWAADHAAQSTFDWSQLRLAVVDGVPAAVLAGTNQFVPDENCGYVQTLATLPAYRGRRLASLLLRDRFSRDAELGRAGTYLHVDANNSTGALDLYESVGMRTVMIIDVWRKPLPARPVFAVCPTPAAKT